MFYLTREEHFSAAHRLFNAAWSDEKNDEIFGKMCQQELAWTQLSFIGNSKRGILIKRPDM